MDAASTEHPSTAIEGLAGHPLQDNRGRIHSPQPPGLFVHEALDASADAKGLAAERHEFSIERETSVGEPGVQRRKNSFIGFDPHEVAGLEIAIASGGRPTAAYLSLLSGKRNTAGDRLKSIVKPAGRASPPVAESQRSIVVEQIEEAARYLRQCSVA